MGNNYFLSPLQISYKKLERINNLRFTPREIDIIACVINGKTTAKSIASFLAIQSKTVEVHTYNIRVKLECHSRGQIIEFIERSDYLFIVRQHYIYLLIESIFIQKLQEISKIALLKNSIPLISYERKYEIFVSHLKKYLHYLGIKGIFSLKEKETSIIDCLRERKDLSITSIVFLLSSLETKEVSIKENASLYAFPNLKEIIFLGQANDPKKEEERETFNSYSLARIYFRDIEDYYLIVSDLFKNMFFIPKVDKLILEFKQEYRTLKVNKERTNSSQPHVDIEHLNAEGPPSLFQLIKIKTNRVLIGLISFIFLSGLFVLFSKENFSNYFINKYNKKKADGRLWQKITSHVVTSNLPEPIGGVIDRRPQGFNKSYLTTLWEALHGKGNFSLTSKAFLSGMGGIGKTTLALVYAHEALSHRAYNVIAWVNSETQETLLSSYEKVLKKLKHSLRGSETPEEIIDLFKECFRAQSKWLIIYDNAPHQQFLEGKVPYHSEGHILVTSRSSKEWESDEWGGKLIKIDVFRLEEAIKYILERLKLQRNTINMRQAHGLAQELGNLPLALSHAVAYINYMKEQGETISTYLSKFRQMNAFTYEDLQQFNSKRPALNYKYFIQKTLKIVGKNLTALENKLIAYFAYFNPDKIDLTFFAEIASEKELKRAVAKLSALSLIKLAYPYVSIHRLVQLTLRNNQNSEERKRIAEELLRIFRKKSESLINIEFYSLASHKRVFNFLSHLYPLLGYARSMKIDKENFYFLQFLGRILYLASKDIYSYSVLTSHIKLRPGNSSNLNSLDKSQKDILTQCEILFEKQPDEYAPELEHFFETVHSLHPSIQCVLGSMYREGYGVSQNYKKSIQWYQKAAMKNDSKAQYYLGQLYRIGAGISSDEKKAYEWYQKAAMKNDGYAQYRLGKIYRQGHFFPRNEKKSQYYYKQALQGLKKSATQNIDVKSQQRASYLLGKMYEYGLEVKIDLKEALRWYLKADELSYDPARGKIINLAKGWKVPQEASYMIKNFIFSSTNSKEWKNHEMQQAFFTDKASSLAIFKEKLYLVYVGKDNRIYISSSSNGEEWISPRIINPEWSTHHSISLASLGDTLYLVYVGKDNRIYISSSVDGTAWKENWIATADWFTPQAVSLISFKEKLYLAYIGYDHKVYLSSSPEGQQWQKPWQPAPEKLVSRPVSLAAFKEKLYLAYVADKPYKRRIFLTCSSTGKEWEPSWEPRPAWWFTKQPVSLISFQDMLLLIHVGGKPYKGKIFLSCSTEGKKWEESWKISEEVFSDHSLSLAVFQDKLFLSYVGIGKDQYKSILSYFKNIRREVK